MLFYILVFLILINGCDTQTPEKLNSPPKIVQTGDKQVGEQNAKSTGSASDVGPEFNLPADPDSPGWVQTSGPLGGTVIRMIPHEGTVWTSLYSGGIYELQKDYSWKQIAIGHGIPENRAFDIVLDPSNANIAYVPEMIACLGRTVNGGESWEGLCDRMLKNIESPNFNSHTLALDPSDPKTIYVPGHMHDQTSILLISKDGGENWKKQFTFNQHYDFNHLFFFNSKMYLATVENGVFVSSDQGKNWAPFNEGLEDIITARFVNFDNTLYLLGARLQYNVRMGGKLYRMVGTKWEKVNGLSQVTGIGSNGTALFVGTWDPGPKLWISTDGNSFQETESRGLPPDWIGEIVALDSKIYVGAGGNGIYVSSDNGNNFEEFNNGMISVATREVHVNPRDENEILVGTWDRLGFYWSKNGGKGYHRVATEYNVLTLQPDPHDFSRIYIGGDRFAVGYVSREKNQFMEKSRPGKEGSFIKSLAIDPRDSNHILAGVAAEIAETPPGEGLWESHNQGESWTRAQGIGNAAVYSIIFHPNDSNIVYASALGEGVFKSIDGGSHFTRLGNDQLKYTYRLAMSPTNPNILIAPSHLFFGQLSSEEQISGKYGGIFQSKDGGMTWIELTKGIRNYEGGDSPEDFLGWLYNFGHLPNYEQILIDPKDSNHLIVGHHGENVVVTLDGGKTWEKAEQMVPGNIHNYAYCLGSSSSFDKIYACTCGRGLFRAFINGNNYITGLFTAETKEIHSDEQPHNAEEARRIILSGEYNHKH